MKRTLLIVTLLLALFLTVFLTGCAPDKFVVPPQPKLEFSFDVFGKETSTYIGFSADDGRHEVLGSSTKWFYDRPENLQEYIIIYGFSGTIEFHLHTSRNQSK